MVRVSDNPPIPRRRSTYQPLAVSITVNGVTTVFVHGPGGPGTMVTLVGHDGTETVIPSATLVNVHPDDHGVAWDGEQFVMLEGIADIIVNPHLSWVASVTPIEILELTKGIKPSPLYHRGPSEVERRRQMLDEYKAATNTHSDRKIYLATNSGIHKPQFYEWRDGRLPATSATTINFERFLSDKKPPIMGGR